MENLEDFIGKKEVAKILRAFKSNKIKITKACDEINLLAYESILSLKLEKRESKKIRKEKIVYLETSAPQNDNNDDMGYESMMGSRHREDFETSTPPRRRKKDQEDDNDNYGSFFGGRNKEY